MHEVLKIAGLIGAIWFAVSVPAALLIGRALKRNGLDYPAVDEIAAKRGDR